VEAPFPLGEDFCHGGNSWRKSLVKKEGIKPCKWYYCCPIRTFTEQGKLERYWVENYCLVGSRDCVRYGMEEKGQYHRDNMLPNGEIRENLQ
jgi:hypothetical protein